MYTYIIVNKKIMEEAMSSFELYGDMLKIYREVDLQCGYKLDIMLQRINDVSRSKKIEARWLLRNIRQTI